MFESKAGVLFVGGLGFFLFAFVSNGVVPIFMYQEPAASSRSPS